MKVHRTYGARSGGAVLGPSVVAVRRFRSGRRGALLLAHGDKGEAEATRDLDEDADPGEHVERGEDLQPWIRQHEVGVGNRRGRQGRDGEVETVDEAPVLTEGVRQRADNDEGEPAPTIGPKFSSCLA